MDILCTFLHSNLSSAGLGLLLCRGLLTLLHAPYLIWGISTAKGLGHRSARLTFIMVCGGDKMETGQWGAGGRGFGVKLRAGGWKEAPWGHDYSQCSRYFTGPHHRFSSRGSTIVTGTR